MKYFRDPKPSTDADDFIFDWSRKLGTVKIVSQSTTVDGAVLVASNISADGGKVLMRIGGGVSGSSATIACSIVTSDGRPLIRKARLEIFD